MSDAALERAWTDRFDAAAAVRAGEPTWLAAHRKAALARFTDLGFPTRRAEEWRYTNPASIARTDWSEAPATRVGPAALDALGLPLAAGPRLVFVNGHFDARLSTPARHESAATLAPMSRLMEREPGTLEAFAERVAADDPLADRAFAQLARALAPDGAWVHIPRGISVATPIWVIFLSVPGASPQAAHPRLAVAVERSSRAVVYEVHAGVGTGARLVNALGEISVGEDAELHHVKLLLEGADALHVAHTAARLARSGRFASALFSLGARLARHDLVAVLDGEGAECDLDGLYVACDGEHVDNRTTIDHRRPHGTSREHYKGVLSGHSRGIFSGLVVVRPDAQKSDARQKNDNLLLSADAEVDSKPQLEIEADDVRCTHGSTIGQLEEDAIFYLRSRGLGAREAAALLTRGFAAQIVGRVPDEAVRDRLQTLVLERLFAGGCA